MSGVSDLAPDVNVGGLTFEGFEPAFAERAAAVFETALADGVAGLGAVGARDVAAIDLEGLDFASPDALGQSLARAILAELQP